jgi:membrane fusion protein, multidrug efflux system
VSADLPGVIASLAFESGQSVREGQVLAVLDTRQERAQLAAAEAQRDLAHVNFTRLEGLLNERVISRAEFDRATAEQRQGVARVGEIGATIERKTIRAPFSGVLGIRHVNLGQYVSGGDALVTLQALDPIYVNFGVPQQAMASVRAGRIVRVTSDGDTVTGGGITLTGRITAMDSVIDESTRNVQAQATLANPQAKLHPGMFVQTEVTVGSASAVVSLPTSSINYAPYGDSVFVVTDLKDPNGKTYRGVRQQFVKLGSSRGDQVAVVSGIKAGDEVVTSGVFKLRNGAAVVVNNKVQPGNDPAPKPENR